MKVSLRAKIAASMLAVVVATGGIATAVGARLINETVFREAQNKVRLDLNTAREILRARIEDAADVVRLTAQRFFVRQAILEGRVADFAAELERVMRTERLDVLTLTDARGTVLWRARNPGERGDSQAHDPLVAKVIAEGRPIWGVQIIPREELLREDPALAERAYIRFVETPKARVRSEREQTSGMMLRAAAPVTDGEGRLIGVLYGGILLNRDCEVEGPNRCIVDRVKAIVYQGETYRGKDIGTVTIFQDDVRISTNVLDSEGRRALGTRVSEEVYDRVVLRGGRWIGPAFVVNDWYISAYEPIRDVEDRIVGMLYVGVLRRKYDDIRHDMLLRFLGITLLGTAGALAAAYGLSSGVIKPLRDLTLAAHEFSEGNYSHRVAPRTRDELGELAEAFNRMAASIQERDRTIRERQQQVMESKRLAMLGQLAAGVAHELNNPLGSIVMYAHLLMEKMDRDDPRRESLAKVIRQATRSQRIVRGLLDFARQSHPHVERADMNAVLEGVLSGLERDVRFKNVRVVRDFAPDLPQVGVDVSQMEQVVTNICLNAAEAMKGSGTLTVGTRLSGGFVEVTFSDTGPGIPPEHIDRIFEPFFTTKEAGHGTGLGLAVSYGIVERHGGSISAASPPGGGAVFTVRIPVAGGGPESGNRGKTSGEEGQG